MSELTRRVLVLGEDTRAFLTVVRSLGRAGLEVHVGWCSRTSAALSSKYVNRFHRLPAYRADCDEWLAAFNHLLQEQQFDLVVPCSDDTILPLQMHRAALICPGRICLLPDDVYRTCASKDQTYLLAQRLEIPLPAQVIASTLDDVRAAAARFGYPLVLKPRSSSSTLNPSTRRVVRKVAGPGDLEAQAPAMLAEEEILVQQNVTGKGVGVEVLCKDGRVLAAFQHERVHEPLQGAGSSYRKSVPLHPGMLEATRRMMQELRYTGVAMAEYKYNPATGGWVLIEINARFWGSLPLAVAAGMDFPRYLYEMWCEGQERFPQQYAINRYCRNLTADLQWMLANLRADRRDTNLMTVPLPRVAAECTNLLLLRERSDTFSWDDWRPAWADLSAYLEAKLFALNKRLGWFRGVQRRRAAEAVGGARNVAFVCHGNICRSPFAAATVARLRPDFAVSSFGCFPQAERRPPAAALEAARRLGVDLSGHRSRVITQADVDGADVILIFDRDNRDHLRAQFSGLQGKVHYLGALEVEGPLEIADPHGLPLQEFVKCYERIRQIEERWFGQEGKSSLAAAGLAARPIAH
jgi:protein-tyrosine-phosphatase/predicted ATP-grasp superfamily ATP-dependent carboligase